MKPPLYCANNSILGLNGEENVADVSVVGDATWQEGTAEAHPAQKPGRILRRISLSHSWFQYTNTRARAYYIIYQPGVVIAFVPVVTFSSAFSCVAACLTSSKKVGRRRRQRGALLASRSRRKRRRCPHTVREQVPGDSPAFGRAEVSAC